MSKTNVGIGSLHVHVHLNDLMTKVFFKKIKTFIITVTCLFFQKFGVCSYYLWTHVCTFQIDLQLYVYIYVERKYMHM